MSIWRRYLLSDLHTPLLDKIKTVDDLRQLPETMLSQLVIELRDETIAAVSQTGGHLGAGRPGQHD